MPQSKGYFQHDGKVIDLDGGFKHVMAISLDPRTDYRNGVIRCIKSREGDVAVSGFVDRSVLHAVHGKSLEHFSVDKEIIIANQDEISRELGGRDADFIGLEDPDIWIDPETDLMHLYFTMPFRYPDGNVKINLGHAVGKDLQSLVMTIPALTDEGMGGAKEVSIAPLNSQGFRYNLVESSARDKNYHYSTVRVAIARDMGAVWEFGDTVLHPGEAKISWIGGDASPGPLLPKDFIDVGTGKLLGILNGRELSHDIDGKRMHGVFSIGLFIYDYENGRIEWFSSDPFIKDSEARNITFASQFVPQGKGRGILYAHVDDSFVRAYDLDADEIRKMLP